MLRWIVLLLIAAGIYYVAQNWSSLTSEWNVEISRLLSSPPAASESPANGTAEVAGTKIPPNTASAGQPTSAVESWGIREVAGLRVDLPYPMQPYTPSGLAPTPANVRLEFYRGDSGARKVLVAHGTNTTMAGGLALSAFNKPLVDTADKIGMDIISTNSVTTLLNGFRARRSDYISKSSPRVRVRCLLLERGNQAWFIESHAPETDASAEEWFQRIARSAQ